MFGWQSLPFGAYEYSYFIAENHNFFIIWNLEFVILTRILTFLLIIVEYIIMVKIYLLLIQCHYSFYNRYRYNHDAIKHEYLFEHLYHIYYHRICHRNSFCVFNAKKKYFWLNVDWAIFYLQNSVVLYSISRLKMSQIFFLKDCSFKIIITYFVPNIW